MFVSKLDSAGGFLWAARWGGSGADEDTGLDVAVDDSGNVYTTGVFVNTVDFDPGPATFTMNSAGDRDVFVSKLDSAGNHLWARQLGGSSEDVGIGIAVDGGGNVHCTGYFEGTADFDPGAGPYDISSAGGRDIFLSQIVQNVPPEIESINLSAHPSGRDSR